jgi:thiosulfate/3-mercaptopyruvate sulfurtransferase
MPKERLHWSVMGKPSNVTGMTDPFVSTAWLADRLGAPGLAIVDGSWYLPDEKRDPRAEFLAGHIPGAVFFDLDKIADTSSGLPHMLLSPEAFAEAAGAMGIGDGMQIVVYDGLGLFSAPRVRWTFRVMGAADVFVLEGGMPKWRAEGRPLESGEPRPERRTFTAHYDPAAVATLDDVRAVLGSDAAQIVDARGEARFRGEAPEPRPGVRSGHIPGAFNVPYRSIVGEGGKLRSPEELGAAFTAAGVDIDKPIVATCGSGVTAGIVALALETLGRPGAPVYDGSWSEWGTRNDLPVETGPGRGKRGS